MNHQGLASVVLSLHQQLDAAVAEAYAWPPTLPEAEMLTRLNHERAHEEAGGHVRYLRPAYQAPDQQQAALALPAQAAVATAATFGTGPQGSYGQSPTWLPAKALAQTLLAAGFLATDEGNRAAPYRAAYPEDAAPVLFPGLYPKQQEQEMQAALGRDD